jgi:sialate O-acetylesterase
MADGFSALALAFANELHKELKVPVGILLTSHSNTRIEAFTERKAIEAHPALTIDKDLIHNGDVATEQGRAAFEKYLTGSRCMAEGLRQPWFPSEKPLKRPNLPGIAGEWRGPSQFFNGKISPVVPYAIRGSLWCQGESNEGDGRLYAARMEALVRGWREAWGMPEMPFYFTQMQCLRQCRPRKHRHGRCPPGPAPFSQNNRENVGMVVQLEFGGGIHYFNKLHPGMRLARWALAKEYGRDIPFTGPIFEKATLSGNKPSSPSTNPASSAD